MHAAYHWLWRLLPGNPLLIRVVQGGSRRQRHLWTRLIYLGALILLVTIPMLASGAASPGVSQTDLAKAATQVFTIVSYGQIIFVCLLAPLFMAGAISQEHSGETFDILLTTPLNNLQILLGSMCGRLFFVLALLLSGLPLFAVLLVFGGVPLQSVFASFAIAAIVAVSVGSVAVTTSALRIGGRKSVFVFVIVIAGYLVACYLADRMMRLSPAMLPGGVSTSHVGHTSWLTPLHPLLVLEATLNNPDYRPPPMDEISHYPVLVQLYVARPLASFMTLGILGSTALLLVSATMLRRVGQGPNTSGIVGKVRRFLRLAGTRKRKPRAVWANPIAWREANTRGNATAGILSRWAFAAVCLIAAFVLIVIYHAGKLPAISGTGHNVSQAELFRTILTAMLLVELVVIVLVAIYMSAGSVSREREEGTLDLFLTTPITPRQYIWGKLRGLVSFLSLLLAIPVLTLAMVSVYTIVGLALDWPQAKADSMVFINNQSSVIQHELLLPEVTLLLPVMLVPFVSLCVAVGMMWSLKARGVLGAIVPTVSIVTFLSMVLYFCGSAFVNNVPFVGPVVNAFSPVSNILVMMDPWGWIGQFSSNPVAGRINLAVGVLIAGGAYAIIVQSLITAMVKNFDHTMRRLSGT